MNLFNKVLIKTIRIGLKFFGFDIIPGDFNEKEYSALNPDITASGINPTLHFIKSGIKEGRLYNFPRLDFHNLSSLKSNKKNLLLIAHEASLTGVPLLTYNLAKDFSKKYNVVVLLLGDGSLFNDFKKLDIVLVSYFLINRSSIVVNNALDKIFKKIDINYCIVNSIECRGSLESLCKYNIPKVLLIHEFLSCYQNPNSILKEISRYSNVNIFSSTTVYKDALRHNGSLKKFDNYIIPQGKSYLPKNSRKKNTGKNYDKLLNAFKGGSKLIVGMGTFDYRKGVDLFVSTAAKINESNNNYKFLWVGKSEYSSPYVSYVEDQVERLGLSKNEIIFFPVLSEIDFIYKKMDALIISSRLDPLPNVAIDALLESKPVFCFENATGLTDFFKRINSESIFMAKYLDVTTMSKKVLKFFNSGKKIDIQLEAKVYFNMNNYQKELEDLLLDSK
jgi:glycosyltransferase involved in cell wall biosynthesis